MHYRWPLLILSSAPLLFLPYGFDTREVPRAALVLALASLLLYCRRVSLSWWSLPWIAVCTLGCVWTPAPANETLLGALPYSQGTLTWLAYALIVLSDNGQSSSPKGFSLPVVASVLTLVQALIALAQLARGVPVVGTLGHPVFFGTWGALGAVVAMGLLRDRQHVRLAWAALVAGLVCIALSGRRSPVVMLLVASIGMIALVRPVWGRVLPIAVAVALPALGLALWPRAELGGVSALTRWLAGGGDAQTTALSRLENFSRTWDAIAQHPWGGLGPSAYADLAATWTPAGLTYYEARPHNLLLLVAFSLGVPALIAFLVFAGKASVNALKHARGNTGSVAAAAVLGPAYACHLLVNIDQPGIGIWVCALWATALPVGGRQSIPRVAAVAFAAALAVAGASLLVGTVAVYACQTSEAACRAAETSGSTGCLALRTRSELARRLDRTGSAQARLQWMQRCQPGDHLARFQHALALNDAGQRAAAIEEMSLVLHALPGVEDVQMALADLLASDGQFSRAVAVLHPERARPDKRGHMWRLVGLLREEQGDALSARDAYEQALRFLPNDPWLTQRVRAMP